MATVEDALKGLNAYPIPRPALETVAERRGVRLADPISAGLLLDKSFRLAAADVLMWLAGAPDVSQGGQSYSFDDAQRTKFRNKAQEVYDELGDATAGKPTYGYKGSLL